MAIDIRTTYKFLLAQYAAESYLDGIDITQRNDVLVQRLTNGSNHYDHLQKFDELTKGPTQMTDVMIDDFFTNWSVIDHYPNTNSGFSATVLRSKKNPNEFTLSFRSTESKKIEDGGDRERDTFGANLQIATEGFAYGQLLDMEEYYSHLQNGERWDETANNGEGDWVEDSRLVELKNHLSSNGEINVTGYSLGGHLAQVFTQMHYEDVMHTYIYNGAGMGQIDGAKTGLEIGNAVEEKLELLRQAMADPLTYIGFVSTQEFIDIGYTLGGQSNGIKGTGIKGTDLFFQ